MFAESTSFREETRDRVDHLPPISDGSGRRHSIFPPQMSLPLLHRSRLLLLLLLAECSSPTAATTFILNPELDTVLPQYALWAARKVSPEEVFSKLSLKGTGLPTSEEIRRVLTHLDGKECDGLEPVTPEKVLQVAAISVQDAVQTVIVNSEDVTHQLRGQRYNGTPIDDGYPPLEPLPPAEAEPIVAEDSENATDDSTLVAGAVPEPEEPPPFRHHYRRLTPSEEGDPRMSRRFLTREKPISDIRDCELHCVLDPRCEAWQWRNQTCFAGSPFPERCEGIRRFYPEPEMSWAEELVRRKAQSKNGAIAPLDALHNRSTLLGEGCTDPVARRINSRVWGARFRYFKFNVEIPGLSSWKEKISSYSEFATLDAPAPEADTDGNQTPPPDLTLFNRLRLKYRIGTGEDEETMKFCKRTSSSLDDPWTLHFHRDPPDLELQRGTTLEKTSRYSLLRLRAVIPREMRTGRWFNFGIGPCSPKDPMHPFFHHQLTGEEKDLVDLPLLTGYGFEKKVQPYNKCSEYGGDRTKVIEGSVTPDNVLKIFTEETEYFPGAAAKEKAKTSPEGVPDLSSYPAIEFLILDIDSWEYEIIKRIVESRLTVLVYMVEMATMFPPPFKYGMKYEGASATNSTTNQTGSGGSSSWTYVPYQTLAGLSFHMILNLLKETHDFFMFPFPGDAVFVHKSLTRGVFSPQNRSPGSLLHRLYPPLQFPMDEFLCYAGSYLWFMYPSGIVREWSGIGGVNGEKPDDISLDTQKLLNRVIGNITELEGRSYDLGV